MRLQYGATIQNAIKALATLQRCRKAEARVTWARKSIERLGPVLDALSAMLAEGEAEEKAAGPKTASQGAGFMCLDTFRQQHTQTGKGYE